MVALEVRSAKRSPWHFKAIAKQSSGFDAVLHLATRAIDVFVEETGAGLGLGCKIHGIVSAVSTGS
jgi:hypothetical protein